MTHDADFLDSFSEPHPSLGRDPALAVAPDAVTLDVTDQAPGAQRGHATNGAPAGSVTKNGFTPGYSVTLDGSVTPGHGSKPPFGHTSTLVLSLFPGIDLMGRGFEQEGYCVVRGPDLIFGGDVRAFHPPPGRFDGIIGGSPCQDFSAARRCPPTGYGVEMLHEFCRCVAEVRPDWFLLENVPGVPDVQVPGYVVQRFDLRADECGLPQRRLRHFQFGSHGYQLVLRRPRGHSRSGGTGGISARFKGCPVISSSMGFTVLQGTGRWGTGFPCPWLVSSHEPSGAWFLLARCACASAGADARLTA